MEHGPCQSEGYEIIAHEDDIFDTAPDYGVGQSPDIHHAFFKHQPSFQFDLKFWQVFLLGILFLAGLSQVFAQLKRSSNE